MFQKAKRIIIPCLIIIGLSTLIHLTTSNIPEVDSFFYSKLAQIYKSDIKSASLAQLPFSTLGELGSSLWYGFSITLIPFTLFNNQIFGIKLAGIFFTAALFIAIFFSLKKQKIIFPWIWLSLFIFSSPNILYRLGMTRPQTLSLMFSILLVVFLLNSKEDPKKTKKDLFTLVFLSFALVWLHFNFLWIPFVIVGAIGLIHLILKKKILWQELLAVLGGVVLGWLFRPHAISAIKLFYVQIIKLITEKQSGLPLLFGSENLPLSSSILFKNFGIVLFIWLIGSMWMFYKIYKNKQDRTKIDENCLSLFLLSLVFFSMTMIVARKAYDFWVIFGIFFLGSFISKQREISPPHIKTKIESSIKYSLIIALVILIPYSGLKTLQSFNNSASTPHRYEKEAEWLVSNSNTGDIVFNANWSNFSPLFFWNSKNRYVAGLDPIFLYDYSPELYWKFHYISAGILTDKTCGKIECRLDELEDTYTVLKEDFKSRYIFVDKNQNPDFIKFLESDNRFEKGIETEKAAVFKLL